MVSLLDLWLPVLLSSVFVFVASSVIHMALPFHKADYLRLEKEPELLGFLRGMSLKRGVYVFPSVGCMKDMGAPETAEKYRQGPVGFLTVMPNGPPALGKSLLEWFIYSVIVGAFVAYVATLSGLARGAEFMPVFRLTATVGILGHAVTNITDSIWKGHRWSSTAKFVGDGIVYGLIIGATFGWLWPALP